MPIFQIKHKQLFLFMFMSVALTVTSMNGHAQRKSEEVLYNEFLEFIKSKGLKIENEYFNLAEKYGTLEKSFWLQGNRSYSIFCFATSGNIKDLDSYVYDCETNEVLAKHTVNHPLGINDFILKERKRVRVFVKLQEHYNNNTTRIRVVIAYKDLPKPKPTEDVSPEIPNPKDPLKTSVSYTAQSLVNQLNNSFLRAYFSFSEPMYNFTTVGRIDNAQRSIYFLAINNKVYVHYTIPKTESCGSESFTVPVKWTGSSGTAGDTGFYIKFNHSLTCGSVIYKGLYVVFKRNPGEDYDPLREQIKLFSEK